jgi:hypothetical protein
MGTAIGSIGIESEEAISMEQFLLVFDDITYCLVPFINSKGRLFLINSFLKISKDSLVLIN